MPDLTQRTSTERERPLAIDLFCGLGGWAEGFLAEGYDVIGFDVERHDYGTGAYPAQLVIQDVLTLHGSQLRDAAAIVGSSPCQEFSYRAMPWKRAKALPPPYLGMKLFEAQFRIQREASKAAGWEIPMVVENVKGAQPWVGRAKWHYGSFYLWGDVPALMPMIGSIKNGGGSWFAIANNTTSGHGQNPDGRKVAMNFHEHEKTGKPGRSFQSVAVSAFRHSSKSNSRKAASAEIAKIPFPLAQHIARVFKPVLASYRGSAEVAK